MHKVFRRIFRRSDSILPSSNELKKIIIDYFPDYSVLLDKYQASVGVYSIIKYKNYDYYLDGTRMSKFNLEFAGRRSSAIFKRIINQISYFCKPYLQKIKRIYFKKKAKLFAKHIFKEFQL